MEWRIFPLDVLFFRGMEPMNAGEAGVVRPQFPPSPEVMQGFVRTVLLDALGIEVNEYAAAVRGGPHSPQTREAIALLGDADTLGQLDLRGPYLVRERGATVERWYPAPLDLRGNDQQEWRAAAPDDVVESDLGTFPLLPSRAEGETQRWISHVGLEAYTRGEPVPADAIQTASRFFVEEERVGIGRDAVTRASAEGMLYAPVLLRLCDNDDGRVGLGITVEGIIPALQQRCAGIHRLGGEGRLVALEVHEAPALPAPVAGPTGRLVLLTPARWGGNWLPPGFVWNGTGGQGSISGQAFTVVSAAVGKPVRIGGWDIVRGRPKPAVACVPAGSVYYLRAESGASVGVLHDRKLGERTAAGFGQAITGRWE